ncbi:hypothetical protein T09_1309, partial [Trichinella sp. T9]
LVDFYWQHTRNEILLRYEKATITKILLLHCPSLRLAVARTERELKHSFEMVSRGKAVYNDTPVESIPEEGVQTEKQLKHSFEGFSRWKALYNETPVEFISEEG